MSSDALDAFSPRALHLLGHHTTWVGAWVQGVALCGAVASHVVARVQAWAQQQVRALHADRAHVGGLVTLAHRVGLAHGLTLPEPPRPSPNPGCGH